jgi:hypothetical protein
MSGKRSRSRWFVLLILTGVGLGALLPVFLWQPLARAGDTDKEPLPQEEQPGWFIYWETYDEPGDNEPIETHPSQWAGGGDPPQGRAALCAGEMRIFPDKKTYTDEHPDKRRLVFAVVEFTEEPEPPPEGTKMWFRLWDVDDPSANGPPIDTKPEGDPGMNGPDNSDESWAMAGVAQQNGMILVEVGTIRRFDRLDVCDKKLCKVAVRVGMRPGDNWRFCAAKEEDETALRDMTQNQADLWQPPPRVAESAMLTTWRKLHLELDSIVSGPDLDNPILCAIVAATWNTPHAGETQCEVGVFKPNDDGRYEGGTMTVSDGGTYNVIDHWDATEYDRVVVAENATADVGKQGSVADDDVSPLPRKADWSLLATKLAPAYVDVKEIPEEEVPGISDMDNLFIANLPHGPSHIAALTTPARDVETSADYWAMQVMSFHQGAPEVDDDPDALYHWHSMTDYKMGDPTGTHGETIRPAPEWYDNVSAIYLETIRDFAAFVNWARSVGYPAPVVTAQGTEQITIVHEIGWAFGCGDYDGGVMNQGIFQPSEVFTPISIYKIRSRLAIEEP